MLAAAPSKVPFYIAGGILASWAVVVALIGITRPGFPGSKAARGGVIAASLLLMAATLSMAILTSGEEAESEAAAPTSSELDLIANPSGAPTYDRKTGSVKAGTVTIRLVNASTTEHNVAVAQGSRQLGESPTINGADTELKLDLRPGEYEYYCTIDGHRAAGMEGVLTVH